MNVTIDFNTKRTPWHSKNNYDSSLISLKNENSNESFINRLAGENLGGFQKYPDLFTAYGCLVNHLNIDRNTLILGNGSGPILKDLLMVLDYDTIQIFNHGWELAAVYSQVFNKKVLANDFVFDRNFHLKERPEKIGGDVLYIANPHCPTGYTFDVDTIFELSTRFKYVIVDEAYQNPLRFNDELLKADNVIVVKTFSKLGGVPGLRLGYCVAHKNVIDKLNAVKDGCEISSVAVNYLKLVTNNEYLITDNLIQLHECFKKLSEYNGGFSIHAANFATFEDFGKLKGKPYVIDSKKFVRVTLTDVINYRWLLV